jgi:predicted nucleotidyltransferase
MLLTETLGKVIGLISKENIHYALAGGLVSNLYRKEARLTNDIDIAILLDDSDYTAITKVFKELGLKAAKITDGDLKGLPFRRSRERMPVQLIVGRNEQDKDAVGVDFLLMSLPWVSEAIARANYNKLSLLNLEVPCLTIEDMIISKLYAIRNKNRFKDLDDLEEFLTNDNKIDNSYLAGRMLRYQLPIPTDIRRKLKINPEIGRMSREIEKNLRKKR